MTVELANNVEGAPLHIVLLHQLRQVDAMLRPARRDVITVHSHDVIRTELRFQQVTGDDLLRVRQINA